MSLREDDLIKLGKRLRTSLPTLPDGTIHLIARAWALRGRRAQPDFFYDLRGLNT
jgi:hypothetical protein